MSLITRRDFETEAGQEKIIKTIHGLEAKVHELNRLVHECLKQEFRLESDMSGYEDGFKE